MATLRTAMEKQVMKETTASTEHTQEPLLLQLKNAPGDGSLTRSATGISPRNIADVVRIS